MKNIIDIQESNLQKRVVTLIKRYPQPKEIFEAITSKEYPYSIQYLPEYPMRDRAMMALYFASAGRGAEVVRGSTWTRSLPSKVNEKGENLCVVCGAVLHKPQRKFCSEEHRKEIHTHKKAVMLEEKHPGILIENVNINSERILISEMEVVKRSPTVIAKYGPQAKIRPPYAIPLKIGLYENEFWDQLVPFGWLIKEYWSKYIEAKRTEGSLFLIQRGMAYRIVREVTGNYLNWFRAQGKQFYGSFLFKRNAVELAEFVNDQDAESERPYTRYDWTTQLKDKTMVMDFDWINPTIEKISRRI